MRPAYGAHASPAATGFTVRAPRAEAVELCLFQGGEEVRRPMTRQGDDWHLALPGDLAGERYGYRAHGAYAPDRNLWCDPAKLLVDPYAVQLDRRFTQDLGLAQPGFDTAGLVPRAIVPGPLPPVPHAPPRFTPAGLIYEINVRAFTRLHPDVPQEKRGTIAALAHPAILAHLRKLHVSAVELMPIVAWLDERHLPPLGLVNAWGYNPVVPMALDPGLCPGGIAELRETVAALQEAGVGVILDLVFNHTGESDAKGGTLSLRGLDPDAYATAPDGSLINDTGCGNTLDFAYPPVRQLTLAALRHFTRHCGIDGFRFDLATVLARGPGFSPDAPIFEEIAADPLLADRVLIAEPWDMGPGGYQLGRFPQGWLEWNDRFRDDVRRFWRGDAAPGRVATRLAGSADLFGPVPRGVHFVAAHDGLTLADTVAYAQRHNQANGEDNRDGHGENFSWNCGVEGPSDDPAVRARRQADRKALLATLFASAGPIMLTAGDEFGRSQQGNNNAYCQDNACTWLHWQARDLELEEHVTRLAEARARRSSAFTAFPQDGRWLSLLGAPMTPADWEDPDTDGFIFIPAELESYPAIRLSRNARSVTSGEALK